LTVVAAQTKIGREDILDSVPQVNRLAKVARGSDGDASIEIPVKRPRFMVPPISWLFPFSAARRMRLDPLGLAVLDLCDGQRTVEDIVETFAIENRLSFREAQVPVMQFLRLLAQRGVLAIVVGERKPAE
jgi:hypothetical protein